MVIVTAVDIERQAVLKWLHPGGANAWDRQETSTNGVWRLASYSNQKQDGREIRIALGQCPIMGMPAAAALTAIAIQTFRPSYVAMVGIAAGKENETKFGDIIVPRQIWDYGAGKWYEKDGNLTFKHRPEARPLSSLVCERWLNLGDGTDFFKQALRDWQDQDPKSAYGVPVIHRGSMVSGSAVVNAKQIWDGVFDQHEKVIAIDMEAYGVACAVEQSSKIGRYHPELLVIKSVCDYGLNKGDGAQGFAAFTSVRALKLYIDEYIVAERREDPAMRNNMLQKLF